MASKDSNYKTRLTLSFFRQKHEGFTLIELSIVIVIIGLLVSSVVAGQSIVKSAKINSSISEIQNYATAYNTFFAKYDALPGDMANAEDYWGTYVSSPLSGVTNGSGDFKIGGAPHTPAYHRESKQAMRHLSQAELIKGNFRADQNYVWALGTDFPKSAYGNNTGYMFDYSSNTKSHFLSIAKEKPAQDDLPWHGGISPNDAMKIDTKLDDGSASTGQVLSLDGASGSGTCLSGVDYDLSITDINSCRIWLHILAR